ncbi:type 1 glutamine amidotransferase [Tianweitania sp. BSSL-BM11]|uniref:Type 1 glutamine amidotransferase n=1 Tax=Tianweitania aestuarii TaxID=2814886 RepID=A0ABS5RXD3_9HYPH|nr:type 1 glutamine amidotransferase domain-containing protein [Tianweitania aestuarii]MBS9721718.1 type 1 glutamine amidotransferase [Tianweitania aestuarii]
MPAINQARIAILATDGFEQSELEVPLKKLRDAGATVDVVSLEKGEIKGWDQTDWGNKVPVDKTLSEVAPDQYDALVLPGGQINPDKLRVESSAVDFVKNFYETGKPLAAICHAPWLLIEAGLVKGKRATSFKSIKTDMINAGANWEDKMTVQDGNMITARKPDDLESFVSTIIEAVEGGAAQRSAAE